MTAIVVMFLGIDPDLVLTATVAAAALITALAMLAIVFFAWAPYVSERWRSQFGVGREAVTADESPAD